MTGLEHKILPMSSTLPFQRGQFASLEALSGGVGQLIVYANTIHVYLKDSAASEFGEKHDQ